MKRADFTVCKKIGDKHYLFNTLFGEIDEVDTELYADYVCGIENISKKYKNILLERHHLQNDNNSQIDLFKKMYDEYKNESKIPIRFYIPLTLSCNLGCTYCFQKNDTKKQDLTFNNLDKIFKSILNIKNKTHDKKHIIVLYGGEPLLSKNMDKINKILEFCKINKISIQIISNGVNTNNYINLFKKYNNLIDNIIITIDGPEYIHNRFRILKSGGNCYNIIKKNTVILEENQIKYSIRINMTKELLDMYNSSGVDSIAKNALIYRVRYKDKDKMCSLLDIYKFLESNPQLIKNLKINIINYFYYLNNNFNNYPLFEFCDSSHIFLYSLDGKSIYSCNEKESADKLIGNYDTNGIVNTNQVYTLTYDDMCEKCKVLPICGGGCSFMRDEQQNYKSCYYYKEIIELINYEIKKLL